MGVRELVIACLAGVAVGTVPSGATAEQTQRRWTPADSSALRVFNTLGHRTPVGDDGDIAIDRWVGGGNSPIDMQTLFSPDGRHFMVLKAHGDVSSDQRATEMLVYRTADAERFLDGGARPSPVSRAVFHTSGNGKNPVTGLNGAVQYVTWCADSSCIRAIAEGKDHYLQLFRLNLTSNKLIQVTHAPLGVIDYFAEGGTVIYKTPGDGEGYDSSPPTFRYPIHRIPRRLSSAFPGDMGAISDPDSQILGLPRTIVLTPNGESELDRVKDLSAVSAGSRLAPDGTKAAWLYGRADQLKIVRFGLAVETLAIVPLQPVGTSDLYSGGVGGDGGWLWTSDGRQLVIAGARSGSGKPEVAVFDVASRSLSPLLDLQGKEAVQTERDAAGNRVAVSFRSKSGRERHVFERKGTAWAEIAGDTDLFPPGRKTDLELRIEQANDRPPRFIVARGDRKAELFGPDPAIANVRINTPRRFVYRGPDGQEIEAWLTLPADFRPGSPVPMVIQLAGAGDLSKDRFTPDGSSRTGDAMQALSARGIGVASINVSKFTSFSNTPANIFYQTFYGLVEGLVDALVAQGIADQDRIGLSGFSFAGRVSLSLAAHPARTRIAAVAVNDSFLATFWEEIVRAASGNPRVRDVQQRWTDPDLWRSQEILANFDRVGSPVLFGQPTSVTRARQGFAQPPEVVELIGTANVNAVPSDAVLLTDDPPHGLHAPAQRRAYQTMVVDWYAFWLLGEEDPAPDKYAQYLSWRHMRDVWREQGKHSSHPSPQDGYITTRAGLSYKLTHRAPGVAPGSGQRVTLTYVARNKEGRTLGSGPLAVTLPASDAIAGDYMGGRDKAPNNGLGRGWDELLRILHKGDRATALMTPELALLPNGPRFEGAGPIRFEVEVTGIDGKEVVPGFDPFAVLRRKYAVRDELRAAGVADPGLNPNTLNTMGYKAIYERGDFAEALRLLRWNLTLFPQQAGSLYDSLGEAYLQQGDIAHAIEAYDQAGKAGNKASAQVAGRLRADPGALKIIQAEMRAAYAAPANK